MCPDTHDTAPPPARVPGRGAAFHPNTVSVTPPVLRVPGHGAAFHPNTVSVTPPVLRTIDDIMQIPFSHTEWHDSVALPSPPRSWHAILVTAIISCLAQYQTHPRPSGEVPPIVLRALELLGGIIQTTDQPHIVTTILTTIPHRVPGGWEKPIAWMLARGWHNPIAVPLLTAWGRASHAHAHVPLQTVAITVLGHGFLSPLGSDHLQDTLDDTVLQTIIDQADSPWFSIRQAARWAIRCMLSASWSALRVLPIIAKRIHTRPQDHLHDLALLRYAWPHERAHAMIMAVLTHYRHHRLATVRFTVASVLGDGLFYHPQNQAIASLLVSMLRHADRHTRTAVFDACRVGIRSGSSTAPFLFAHLAPLAVRTGWTMQQWIADILRDGIQSKHLRTHAESLLQTFARHRNWHIQQWAIQAMGEGLRIDDAITDRLMTTLRSFVSHRPALQIALARSLHHALHHRRLDGHSIPMLYQLAESKHPEVLSAVIRTARYGLFIPGAMEPCLGILGSFLSSPRRTVRIKAIEAIGTRLRWESHAEDIVILLAAQRKSRSATVRAAVAAALRDGAAHASTARHVLRVLTHMTKDRHRDVRKAAIQTILTARWHPTVLSSVVRWLLSYLFPDPPSIQETVHAILWWMEYYPGLGMEVAPTILAWGEQILSRLTEQDIPPILTLFSILLMIPSTQPMAEQYIEHILTVSPHAFIYVPVTVGWMSAIVHGDESVQSYLHRLLASSGS